MSNYSYEEYGSSSSEIRELFEYALKRKSEIGSENVFDYSLGNPSISCPLELTETYIDLLKNRTSVEIHGYTVASGDTFLRDKISKYINNTYKANSSKDDFYITCGAAAALTISIHAITKENDEIIIFAPFFPEYKVFNNGAKIKTVISNLKTTDFQIDFEKLSLLITSKTRAVIINSPNNPTGTMLTKETIQNLSRLLKEKSKKFGREIYIISDEPYRELVYKKNAYQYIPNFYNDTIICYSFSKSMSIPGERLGYIQLSDTINNKQKVLNSIKGAGRCLGFVCAPSLSQHVVALNIGKFSDISIYKENRDLLYNELSKMGYSIVYPEGAFYMFIKSIYKDAKQMSKEAKKYELILVPSDSFGITGYVRLSYCVDKEMIIKSLDSFRKLIDNSSS